MKQGFTFKNRHSSEFGVVVKTKTRPLLPEVKTYISEAPLMDGGYDFTSANPFGREFYNDRMMEPTLQITADNLEELERKAAKIAAWLRGSGDLIFDSAHGVKWTGRFVSETAFVPEHRGKTAVVSAVFRAKPIGKATFDTIDGILLGNAVSLDSDLPLDLSEHFETSLTQGKSIVRFVNIGDFYVRPVFEFGDTNNITLSHGDSKIMLEDISGGAIIDLERCVVTDLSGRSIMNKLQGNFFELPPGVSELGIYVTTPCSLKIRYAPQTIYDFDFTDIDWGDGNA